MTLRRGSLAIHQRVLLGVVGLASASAGAVAVFVTDNGTGSAALIAAGFLLCLVAIVGRIVGLKVGGAEADFGTHVLSDVEENLERIAVQEADEGDPETSRAAAENARLLRLLRESLSSAPSRAPAPDKYEEQRRDHTRQRDSFVESAIQAVTRLSEQMQLGVPRREARRHRSIWDLEVPSPWGSVLIEVVYVRPPSEERPTSSSMPLRDRFGRAASEVLAASGRVRVVIVIPAHADERLEQRIAPASIEEVRVVRWAPDDPLSSDVPLAVVLREMVGSLRESG